MFSFSHVLSVVAVLLLLMVIIDMLRRRRLRERHAFWWIVLGVIGLTVTVFPQLLDWIASILGIGVPINLAFFIATVVLFLASTQLSKELTLLEERTRTLAEQISLINDRISQDHPDE